MMATPSSQSNTESASRPTTSSSIQSTLLRLCLICASSQSALREEIPLQILSHNQQVPSVLPGNQLLNQIRNDILSLLSLIQKHSTALTLALKPSKSSTSTSSTPSSISPTSALDEPSLKAAESQLQSLLSDVTPKLAFLVLTALKSRAIYQKLPPTQEQLDKMTKEEKEKEELRLEVEKMGGKLMNGEQLGLNPEGKASSSKIPTSEEAIRLGGIGIAWSNQLRIIIEEVLEKLAFLAESFMDQRTLNAVELSEKARQKKSGITSTSVGGTQFSKKAPTSIKEARQSALEKTKALDNLCKSIKEENRIPLNNEEMCKELWRRNEDVLEDGERELREAIKNSKGPEEEQDLTLSLDSLDIEGISDDEEEDEDRPSKKVVKESTTDQALASASKALDSLELDDDDEDGLGLGIEELTPVQRNRALGLSPLIRIGKLMHRRIGNLCLHSNSTTSLSSSSSTTASRLDLDLLSQLSTALLDAQDDLVCAALYGSNGYGDLLGDLDDDDDEEDDEEEEDNEEEDLECIKEACRNYVRVSKQLSKAASIGQIEVDEKGKDSKAYFNLCSSEIEKLARTRGYLD